LKLTAEKNMAEKLEVLGKIDAIKVNEGSPIRPVDCKEFLNFDDQATLTFSAKLESGEALPTGLSITEDGILAGTPEKGSAKSGAPYKIVAQVSDGEQTVELPIDLGVFKAYSGNEFAAQREKVWQALAEQGVVPESLQAIITRPITSDDIYHLLERYASFTIWNADDLRLADNGKLLKVEGVSDHYHVYDFGVCLVATPKDLYSHDRVLSHAIDTAKAMVKEVYKRGWQVEFGGFDRMASAAWYEVREQNKQGQHQMEVRNYEPPEVERVVAQQQAQQLE